MNIAIVQPNRDLTSETFIAAHAREIREVCGVVHFDPRGAVLGGAPVLNHRLPARASRKLRRILTRSDWNDEMHRGIKTAISRLDADVVLAEYGVCAVTAVDACRETNVPLVAHFHGYDASVHSLLEQYADRYRELFTEAAAVIAVSRQMERRLLSIGCPRHKLIYNPYGVRADRFTGADPGTASPVFVSVGRFVAKKAPYMTVLAFAECLKQVPNARLRMIGDGKLLGICRDLVTGLDITDSVDFLGPQPHTVVEEELRNARAFVQHSVTAENGDAEGTPNAILEAGATGLPVIATRHAGIPDVVVEGQTGLLVDERDVAKMSEFMVQLATDEWEASRLGRNAAQHIRRFFTMDQAIARLRQVLIAAARGESIERARDAVESELVMSEKADRTFVSVSTVE